MMWYYSPTKNMLIYQVRANTFGFLVKMENTIAIYSIPTLGPFSLKNDALPLNSLFWSPPSAVHIFDASDMAVPGLDIYWFSVHYTITWAMNSLKFEYFESEDL